ncbi:MAG: hypothetical protein ABIC04_02215 [Nanoarchaeota archaeon]
MMNRNYVRILCVVAAIFLISGVASAEPLVRLKVSVPMLLKLEYGLATLQWEKMSEDKAICKVPGEGNEFFSVSFAGAEAVCQHMEGGAQYKWYPTLGMLFVSPEGLSEFSVKFTAIDFSGQKDRVLTVLNQLIKKARKIIKPSAEDYHSQRLKAVTEENTILTRQLDILNLLNVYNFGQKAMANPPGAEKAKASIMEKVKKYRQNHGEVEVITNENGTITIKFK